MYPSHVSPGLVQALDELIRADLQDCRDSYFWWLIASSIIVAIGVILEGPEVIHETIGLFRSSETEHSTPAWIKVLALFGWILIAVGVAGEGIAESFVSKTDGTLQTFNDILLSDAQKEAAFALDRAANNEKEAAQLRKDAEGERLARVKIEAKVAWRHLTKARQAELAAQLGDWGNIASASFWYEAGDIEGENFAVELAECLKIAGIVVAPPSGALITQPGGQFGASINPVSTGVVVQSTKDKRARRLTDSLVGALNRMGFDAMNRDVPNENRTGPQIWVMVEPRPEGPQGEYKLQAEREAKAKNKTKASK